MDVEDAVEMLRSREFLNWGRRYRTVWYQGYEEAFPEVGPDLELDGADLSEPTEPVVQSTAIYRFPHHRLGGANLQGASLRSANLRGNDLGRVRVEGADFTGANLDDTTFEDATFDKFTIWPSGFDPIAHGAVIDPPPRPPHKARRPKATRARSNPGFPDQKIWK